MNKVPMLEEFIESLNQVNNLSGLQKEAIIARIKEFDNLTIDKENLEESTFYPYSPYNLNMSMDDELILSLCVNDDYDAVLEDISEDVFPEIAFVEMVSDLSNIDFGYIESCNIER